MFTSRPAEDEERSKNMITMNVKGWFLGPMPLGILPISSISRAADKNDITQLEKQLIQKETEPLDPEMKLDTPIVERAKLDGVGGWFSGGKKINSFVDEYIRPAKRELDESMNHYNEVVSSRSRIIGNYITPYKAKVEAAKEAFELMRALHEAVFFLHCTKPKFCDDKTGKSPRRASRLVFDQLNEGNLFVYGARSICYNAICQTSFFKR